MRKKKPTAKIHIKNRKSKAEVFYPIYKKGSKESESISECPNEEPITEETEIEKKVSSEITPTYKVLWDEKKTSTQIIRILVSDKDFLKAILKELNRNLTRFEWSPVVWCWDLENTTINAIAKINENNIAELKNFIDEIKSSYSI
jgi:hypothetical protein